MMLKRIVGVSLSLAIILSATAPASVFADSPVERTNVKTRSSLDNRALARHLLNRVAYGPRKSDIDVVLSKGVDQYLTEQLNPKSIPMPEQLRLLSQKSSALHMTPAQMFLKFGKPQMKMAAGLARGKNKKGRFAAKPNSEELKQKQKDFQKQFRQTRQKIYREITDARLMRAVYSPRQLEEVMTEFWFNHFNVTFDKGLDYLWVGAYEENAIRPHVLGKFRDLLDSTAHHAAMLFYLDNWQNTTDKAVFNRRGQKKKKKGRFSGINENYARELMELHTLGVDGGYSQADVVSLARILTGHGIQNRRALLKGIGPNSPDGYFFDSRRHDFSDKIFLGRKIKGEGKAEIDRALDILAKHPSTAKHVSFKLAQFFVSDKPPEALVSRLARKFKATDGDIKEVMAELLDSDEFWNANNVGAKYKSPYRFVVSSLRATDAVVLKARPILGFLHVQGMPLYRCLTPDGYKNTEEAWLNPHGLIQRIEYATALGSSRHPAARPREKNFSRLLDNAGITPGSKSEKVIVNAHPRLKTALVVGSPEFMMY